MTTKAKQLFWIIFFLPSFRWFNVRDDMKMEITFNIVTIVLEKLCNHWQIHYLWTSKIFENLYNARTVHVFEFIYSLNNSLTEILWKLFKSCKNMNWAAEANLNHTLCVTENFWLMILPLLSTVTVFNFWNFQ